MLKHACVLCKIVGILAIIGTLNWGLIGILHMNLVEQIFGVGTMVTRVLYILVGLSGVMLLLSYFTNCPGCRKD